MKTLILILLGVAMGWFVHSSIVCKLEQIYDWRDDAKWAAFALLDIVAVLILFP